MISRIVQTPSRTVSFFKTTEEHEWMIGFAMNLVVSASASKSERLDPSECLDRRALFNFNARPINFPALGCTGIALSTGDVLRAMDRETGGPWQTCWLKSNVSLESLNDTANFPGYDGAVLLDF